VADYKWPNNARAAVSLTFDVDGEAGWLGISDDYAERLTSLSDGRYGIARGLRRILEVLEEFDLKATFYVPGRTAELHPAVVAALVDSGHEVAHHGYLHRPAHLLDYDGQRNEIERGLVALETCIGRRPAGYRAPFWDVTPATFALLKELAFRYDSSFMGDDRPYVETYADLSICELPVHWFLDDWPHFSWSNERGGQFADRYAVIGAWLDELDSARAEGRSVTYTMHPEVTGRADHLPVLRKLIEGIKQRGDLWIATHEMVASHITTLSGGNEQ